MQTAGESGNGQLTDTRANRSRKDFGVGDHCIDGANHERTWKLRLGTPVGLPRTAHLGDARIDGNAGFLPDRAQQLGDPTGIRRAHIATINDLDLHLNTEAVELECRLPDRPLAHSYNRSVDAFILT